jgi:hypothetical protein
MFVIRDVIDEVMTEKHGYYYTAPISRTAAATNNQGIPPPLGEVRRGHF